MKPLPHYYDVTATTRENGRVEITSNQLTPLVSAPPAEFDGPGNLWSPETLLVAAVADCFVLTFQGIAKASKLQWTSLTCKGNGTLDRSDGVTRFTAIHLLADLVLPAAADTEKAHRILEKAEKNCLVGNSLKCAVTLEAKLTMEEPAIVHGA